MAAISPTNADARLRISRRCVRLCKLQFERDALFLSSRSRSEDVTGSLERRFCALIARRPWTNLTPKPRPRQWENPLHAYVRFGSKLARVGRGYTSISVRCPSNSDRLGAWQRTDARCQSGLLQCNSLRDPDGPVSRDLLWRGGTGPILNPLWPLLNLLVARFRIEEHRRKGSALCLAIRKNVVSTRCVVRSCQKGGQPRAGTNVPKSCPAMAQAGHRARARARVAG
jgi:hypothetical protein